MFIFEENYYQYDIVYLKSAIRLLEAGSRDVLTFLSMQRDDTVR